MRPFGREMGERDFDGVSLVGLGNFVDVGFNNLALIMTIADTEKKHNIMHKRESG